MKMWLGVYGENEADGNGYEVEKDVERVEYVVMRQGEYRNRIGEKQIHCRLMSQDEPH
jgi:ferredoxin-thioredoxin reductase catalytic subunit